MKNFTRLFALFALYAIAALAVYGTALATNIPNPIGPAALLAMGFSLPLFIVTSLAIEAIKEN